jgi:hypothetical protein
MIPQSKPQKPQPEAMKKWKLNGMSHLWLVATQFNLIGDHHPMGGKKCRPLAVDIPVFVAENMWKNMIAELAQKNKVQFHLWVYGRYLCILYI